MPIVSGKQDLSEEKRLTVLKVLAEAGSDLNACDTSGRTPLHWAVFANARRIVQYLLRLGKLRVDASIRDVCGYTPAQIARNREQDHLAQVLDLFVEDEPWEELLAWLVQQESTPSGGSTAPCTTTKRRSRKRGREEQAEPTTRQRSRPSKAK
jgi:hypothetical protein